MPNISSSPLTPFPVRIGFPKVAQALLYPLSKVSLILMAGPSPSPPTDKNVLSPN